jgi:hypothetical protein
MKKMSPRAVARQAKEFDGIAARWHAPFPVLGGDAKPMSFVKNAHFERSQ